MPYSLNCIGCRLFRLAHFTLKYAFKDGHVFCLAHFFFSPRDLSLSECTRLDLSTYLLKDVLVFPMFWHLSIKLLETSMLRIPWRIYFQLHWVIAEDKIAGHMRSIYLTLKETAKLSSKVAASHWIHTSNNWWLLLLHIFAALDAENALDFSHSNRCVVGFTV